MAQELALERGVDRHPYRPRLVDREPGDHRIGAVVEDRGDAFAGRDPDRTQPEREPVALAIDLREAMDVALKI